MCIKFHIPDSSDSLVSAVTLKDPDCVPSPLCWTYYTHKEHLDGLGMFLKNVGHGAFQNHVLLLPLHSFTHLPLLLIWWHVLVCSYNLMEVYRSV